VGLTGLNLRPLTLFGTWLTRGVVTEMGFGLRGDGCRSSSFVVLCWCHVAYM
jgi:hypothetical protein